MMLFKTTLQIICYTTIVVIPTYARNFTQDIKIQIPIQYSTSYYYRSYIGVILFHLVILFINNFSIPYTIPRSLSPLPQYPCKAYTPFPSATR